MALLDGFFGEMHGAIAGNVYQRGRFGNVVRNKGHHVDNPGAAQMANRCLSSAARAAWHLMSPGDRQAFKDAGIWRGGG
jgi:hypothetical protein